MSYNSGVEVLLNNGLNNQTKKAGLITANDAGEETFVTPVNSISFSNIGLTPVVVMGNEIPAGVTVSFDAGGAENRFPGRTFTWDSTAGILLIAYTY